MSTNRITAVIVVILGFTSTVVFGIPSRIATFHNISPNTVAKLEQDKFVTSERLYAELTKGSTTLNEKLLKSLAKKTKIAVEELRGAFCQCDLLRLNPITTKISYLLVSRNICGAPDLASSNARHILDLLKSANDQYKLLDELPSDQEVIAWIEESKKLVNESTVVTGTWEIEKSLTELYKPNSSILNAFHEQKITTNIQLIEKYPGWGELKKFVEKTGLPEGETKKFYSQADLLRMKSMTPQVAYLIAEVDVFGCIGLANKTAASLEKALKEKNATLKILPKDLTLDEITQLVNEAKNYSTHK